MRWKGMEMRDHHGVKDKAPSGRGDGDDDWISDYVLLSEPTSQL